MGQELLRDNNEKSPKLGIVVLRPSGDGNDARSG